MVFTIYVSGAICSCVEDDETARKPLAPEPQDPGDSTT